MSETMQPTPGGASAGGPAAAMRVEIAALQQQIRDLKALQASGRWWVTATLLIVIAMFAVFTYGTYARIKGNFSDAAVQQAMSQHGAEVVPLAQTMLMETGKAAMPAYRDAIVATMRDKGPAAATAAVDKFKSISQASGKEFQDKMNKAFDAAVARIEPDFKLAYPNMPDEKRQELMKTFASEQIDATNKRLAGQINTLYTNDLIRTQSVLDTLQVPEAEANAGGRDMLEKKFLHTMVALLDQQIDDAYAAPATGDVQTAGMKMSGNK